MEYPSKSTEFPMEIIEQIVDDLQDDIAALTSVSQTCHALLQLCRKRLFRSVDLTPSGLPQAKKFRRSLQFNPDIGNYVREVKSLYISQQLQKWVPGKPNNSTKNIQTLTQMPFLEKLYILGGVVARLGYSTYTCWHSLHLSLQQPVLDRIHSPSLTELHISYFMFPISIFRSALSLSALTIMTVEVVEMPIPRVDRVGLSSHPIAIPQLRSFTFQERSNEFASSLALSCGIDGHPTIGLDRLKTLIAHCYNNKDVQAIKNIFQQAAELETFACKAKTSCEGFRGLAGWINVGAFLTLKTLKVEGNVRSGEDPLRGLCEELEIFPGTNVLEVLDIKVIVDTDHLVSIGDEWGRLDLVLRRGFSRLRMVSISVIFWRYLMGQELEETRRELEEISQKQFPWLRGNKAVKFDFSTSVDW